MSTERPILFTGPMVRAILEGRKTQTRRIVRDRVIPIVEECFRVNGKWCNYTFDYNLVELCPYGKPGDRLWVKESYSAEGAFAKHETGRVVYMADHPGDPTGLGWTPSIFMPRWASRITLEITGVRVERLHDISEEDAKSEGITDSWPEIECNSDRPFRDGYRWLWNSINLKPSPVYEKIDGKKVIVSYESYPWSNDDFDVRYPGVREDGVFRGKPITVTPNPWVWKISFSKI